MPEEGVHLTQNGNLLTTPEILKLASLFVSQGVTKIKLTGGEPTIRKDLLDIVSGLHALRPLGLKTIGITTNGVALKRKLPLLVGKLDQINISLDTLDPLQFQILTRRNGFKQVLESIHQSVAMNFETKINCVVIKGVSDHQVLDFVALTKQNNLAVRFIEYMPFDGYSFFCFIFYYFKRQQMG